MAGQLEVEVLREIALKYLDSLELELNDLTALGTDQMIVVCLLKCSLVAYAFAGRNQRHTQQPSLNEQGEDPVDCRGVRVT